MKAIMACEKNGGIGLNGAMPWPKEKKDLARFKQLTEKTTILMGKGTWESNDMPAPLPNRTNIVVSTSKLDLPDNVIQVDSINGLDYKIDWVIGGAKLFDSIIEQLEEIHLTHFRNEYECDVFINLDKINELFYCHKSVLCLTHTYEIWKKRNL